MMTTKGPRDFNSRPSQQISWEYNSDAVTQSLDDGLGPGLTLRRGSTWMWAFASARLTAALSSTCRPLQQMEKVAVGI